MCLRFVFLLITRMASWRRLSRHEEAWLTAQILILRHQIAVSATAAATPPDVNWADRALLVTLLAVIPNARRHGLRLLVTPDTIVRWHRGIAGRRSAARSMRGNSGWPAARRNLSALVLPWPARTPDGGTAGIHGELAGLGVKIAAPTVGEIVKKAGIGRAPRRPGST